MCRAGGFIQLLETAYDEAHRTFHLVLSREKCLARLLSWASFRTPDVPFAPVSQNFNVHFYKLEILSVFAPSPKNLNKFLSRKGLLRV